MSILQKAVDLAKKSYFWHSRRIQIYPNPIQDFNVDNQILNALELACFDAEAFLDDWRLMDWLNDIERNPKTLGMTTPIIDVLLNKAPLAANLNEDFQTLFLVWSNRHKDTYAKELLIRLVNAIGPVEAVQHEHIMNKIKYFSYSDEDGRINSTIYLLGVNSPEVCRANENFLEACRIQRDKFHRYPPIELDKKFMQWFSIRQKARTLGGERVANAPDYATEISKLFPGHEDTVENVLNGLDGIKSRLSSFRR